MYLYAHTYVYSRRHRGALDFPVRPLYLIMYTHTCIVYTVYTYRSMYCIHIYAHTHVYSRGHRRAFHFLALLLYIMTYTHTCMVYTIYTHINWYNVLIYYIYIYTHTYVYSRGHMRALHFLVCLPHIPIYTHTCILCNTYRQIDWYTMSTYMHIHMCIVKGRGEVLACQSACSTL